MAFGATAAYDEIGQVFLPKLKIRAFFGDEIRFETRDEVAAEFRDTVGVSARDEIIVKVFAERFPAVGVYFVYPLSKFV